MSPFARLGLSEDADQAQIKRAYARELRLARPDEDPQAFQQLHEAYLRCLELAAPEDAADFSDADAPVAAFDDVTLQFDAPALQPLDAIDPRWPAAAPSTLWRYSHR
ncbi:J domain-containing protein, partial [Lysobacter sp. 2RAB21]